MITYKLSTKLGSSKFYNQTNKLLMCKCVVADFGNVCKCFDVSVSLLNNPSISQLMQGILISINYFANWIDTNMTTRNFNLNSLQIE